MLKLDRKVIYVHRDGLYGVDIWQDLSVLVPENTPVCIDVGANTGQTIDFILQKYPEAFIYAFEPSSDTYKRLSKRRYGDNVMRYRMGLGEKEGEVKFNNYENPCLSSFLNIDNAKENRFKNVKLMNEEIVRVTTIDSFVEKNNISQIDLLKIDTQGGDYSVLKGASVSLKTGIVKNIMIELNFVKMYYRQGSVSEIVECLSDRNYNLVDLYEKVRQKYALAWCTALFSRLE